MEMSGGLLGLPSWLLDQKSPPAVAVLGNVRTQLKLTGIIVILGLLYNVATDTWN